jgi:hypothetical protein
VYSSPSPPGEKGGSGDQREMHPAAWMIFVEVEARGWRPPAPRPRPRGEERERERREEERDGGGGLGAGVGVEAVVLEWRLWGGRYAMAAARRRAVRVRRQRGFGERGGQEERNGSWWNTRGRRIYWFFFFFCIHVFRYHSLKKN